MLTRSFALFQDDPQIRKRITNSTLTRLPPSLSRTGKWKLNETTEPLINVWREFVNCESFRNWTNTPDSSANTDIGRVISLFFRLGYVFLLPLLLHSHRESLRLSMSFERLWKGRKWRLMELAGSRWFVVERKPMFPQIDLRHLWYIDNCSIAIDFIVQRRTTVRVISKFSISQSRRFRQLVTKSFAPQFCYSFQLNALEGTILGIRCLVYHRVCVLYAVTCVFIMQRL